MQSSFALWVGLGASLGMYWVAYYARRVEHVSRRQLDYRLNGGLVTLAGTLLGARLGYVLLNWGYYSTRFIETIDLWQGGLTWPGALIGALVALWGFARWNNLSPGGLADALLPLAVSVITALWIGAWQNGVAYGPEVNAWWGLPAIDEWGKYATRWPVQILGALLTLATFTLIEVLRPRLTRPGMSASLAFLALAAQLVGLSLLRADPAPMWREQRLDSWISLAVLTLALLGCLATFVPAVFDKKESQETWTVTPRERGT